MGGQGQPVCWTGYLQGTGPAAKGTKAAQPRAPPGLAHADPTRHYVPGGQRRRSWPVRFSARNRRGPFWKYPRRRYEQQSHPEIFAGGSLSEYVWLPWPKRRRAKGTERYRGG